MEDLKNNSQNFVDFVDNYLKENCEEELFEMTVLTGHSVGGAGKSPKDEYYSSYVRCLAYIDREGKLKKEEVSLFYFLENTTPLKYLDIKKLSVYNVLVKKLKDKNIYCIVKLNGKVETTVFDEIIKEETTPLEIEDGENLFEFDRTYGWYAGKVKLEGKRATVLLYPERKTKDATKSLNTFRKIEKDFKNFYHTVLSNCAESMVGMANEWKDEDDTHEITAEEIYRRIDKGCFDIEIRDTKLTIYFEDDDLFLGHTILYEGDIENKTFHTTIAG